MYSPSQNDIYRHHSYQEESFIDFTGHHQEHVRTKLLAATLSIEDHIHHSSLILVDEEPAHTIVIPLVHILTTSHPHTHPHSNVVHIFETPGSFPWCSCACWSHTGGGGNKRSTPAMCIWFLFRCLILSHPPIPSSPTTLLCMNASFLEFIYHNPSCSCFTSIGTVSSFTGLFFCSLLVFDFSWLRLFLMNDSSLCHFHFLYN